MGEAKRRRANVVAYTTGQHSLEGLLRAYRRATVDTDITFQFAHDGTGQRHIVCKVGEHPFGFTFADAIKAAGAIEHAVSVSPDMTCVGDLASLAMCFRETVARAEGLPRGAPDA